MSEVTAPDQAATTPATPTSTPATEPAAASTTAVGNETTTTDKAAESTSPQVTAEENRTEGLLSDAEWEQVKNDPAAARDALNKAWTQKTQSLAEQRKKIGAWQTVADAFEADPEAAKAALLRQLGVDVGQQAAEQTAQATTQQTQVAAGDQAVVEMRAALEEYGLEALADKLAAPIRKIAEDIAGQKLKPIEEHTGRLLTESAQRELNITLERFTEKRPDWKQHEPAMLKVASQLKLATDPRTGKMAMSEIEYLDTLYVLANHGNVVKSEVQKAIDRINQAAASAEPVPGSTVTSDKVQNKAPKGASFKDAVAAAKAGVSWD